MRFDAFPSDGFNNGASAEHQCHGAAISGGTGPYATARGQAEQLFLSATVTPGVKPRFVFDTQR